MGEKRLTNMSWQRAHPSRRCQRPRPSREAKERVPAVDVKMYPDRGSNASTTQDTLRQKANKRVLEAMDEGSEGRRCRRASLNSGGHGLMMGSEGGK